MPVHFSVGPLFPSLPDPAASTDGPPAVPSLDSPPGHPFDGDRLELLVTPQDSGLNRDGSAVRLHPRARPTHTLTLDEIVAAPEARRSELLRRFRDLLATKARTTGPLDLSDARVSLRDGPWRIEVRDRRVEVTVQLPDGGRVQLRIDAHEPARPQVELDPPSPERGAALAFLLDAFQQLLGKPAHLTRTIPAEAHALFALLLGPGGLLNPQDRQLLPAAERVANPKLIAWDFNGTVGDGHGSFRPDMRDVSDTLNRMGAASVITTTIDPQPIERLLAQANIHFNAFFGGREVRDYPKNKHYGVLAETYGLDLSEARARMVVIGDSKTDIPSDLPGVLFVNNDDHTPAEVIQLLLHELDRLGHGDFAAGLGEALGDELQPGERRRLQIGSIHFAVELRDGSNTDTPCGVPTLHDVRVALDDDQLVTLLSTPPSPAKLGARARYELGFRYIEGLLPEERLAGLLRQLANVPDRAALVAAGQARLEERRALVQSARRMAGELLREPNQLPMDRLLDLAAALAEVGDPETAATLRTFADQFATLNRRAATAARDALFADRDRLAQLLADAQRASVDAAGGPTTRGGTSATTEADYFRGDAKGLVKLFGRMAESPLSASDRARAKLLGALGQFLEKPFPGLEDLFAEMAARVDASAGDAATKLDRLFAEREARADELRTPAATAGQLAPEVKQRWGEIAAAWEALLR